VVGAQQLRGELPAVGGQPLLHGLWCGVGVDRRGGRVAGEDGSITAHRTREVEHGSVGLAAAAVLSGEELAGPAGVGAEPGDGQVGPLRGGFLPCSGLMPAARARPGFRGDPGPAGVRITGRALLGAVSAENVAAATVLWAWGGVPTVALLRWP